MSLEFFCKIDVIFKKTDALTKTVLNNTDDINLALSEMGLVNTTGIPPSNDKVFISEIKKVYKELKDISFTNLAKDLETDETYILIKEEDYNVRKVLKDLRQKNKFMNRGASKLRTPK